MAIFDLFSNRNVAPPDVFTYMLTDKFRVQFVAICREDIRQGFSHKDMWEEVARIIAREHGLLELPNSPRPSRANLLYERPSYFAPCMEYVLRAEGKQALDLILLVLRIVDHELREDHGFLHRSDPDAVIREVNQRLFREGIGYEYAAGEILKKDSEVLHASAVKPALALLSRKGFNGPNREFLAAYEHWRQGNFEAAITDACKAFESTMKAVLDARKVAYEAKATANQLIRSVINSGLLPEYSSEQLEVVAKSLLGVATVRNKNAGHGAGAEPRVLDERWVAYALHLAASNIVFLVESHLDSRKKKAK